MPFLRAIWYWMIGPWEVIFPIAPAKRRRAPRGGGQFMTSLKALVGGWAERLWITSRWEAWLDEDGRSAGKPVNRTATRPAQSFGWQAILLGLVVIVGLDKDADTGQMSLVSPALSDWFDTAAGGGASQ
jgi:hypothetical protein